MPGMKAMMYIMPVMFLFIFNDYASGLSYYYFLSLLITIVQTYIFRHVIDEKKVRDRSNFFVFVSSLPGECHIRVQKVSCSAREHRGEAGFRCSR